MTGSALGALSQYVRCENDHTKPYIDHHGHKLHERLKVGHSEGPHFEDCAEVWECLCGNQCHLGGFYSCDDQGTEVEPTEKSWTSGLVYCADCLRRILVETGEIIWESR